MFLGYVKQRDVAPASKVVSDPSTVREMLEERERMTREMMGGADG